MLGTLVVASLLRHRTRTLLAVAGVAVSAAMLLDMVMLASGMRASFRQMLLSRGFQLRIAPKGTLPFDTEATIADAAATIRTLRSNPDVVTVSPVLGGQLHAAIGGRTVNAVAIGIDPAVQGDYEIVRGRNLRTPNDLAASAAFLAAAALRPGDSVRIAAGYDPELRAFTGVRVMALAGEARFLYMPANTRAVALPLATLQAMQGAAASDRASLFMLRVRAGADVESVRRWIERVLPRVSTISTEAALRQVDERLSYFRQLAFILGTISLIVGFLLVTTLVSVSVNERIGEIAILRAIGVVRARVVLQILIEGAAIMLAGALGGLGLGLLTARYLNSILASFPGLPEAIDFFLFEPRDAWTALALISVAGILAGVYPAWRGASLPIATTLREEAVG